MTDTSYSISLNTSYKSVEYQYAVLNSQNTSYYLEEQIRRLDCKTQYAVLGRRFDTLHPTGGYDVSGANQHLTYTDKDLVDVIDISYLGITVSHPNGTGACITKVGNMVLNKFLTLHDVLVVLEYRVSLMSVHKLARDNNLIVTFDESKSFVLPQDLRDLKVLGTGRQIDGLYYFNEGIQSSCNKSICNLSKGVWHSRLGHLSEQVLPSSVLNGESPYKLVFNKKPILNHLRTFGCLCYATILTNSDKFSSRSEKYALVGYSSVKKDVEILDTPCDEDRVINIPNSDGSNFSQVGSPTIDQNENVEIHFSSSNRSVSGSKMAATLEDNHNNSKGDDGNIQNIETDQITQPVRRSERSSIFPNKYNDFVVDSKVKYGLEKYVNYLKLNSENKCFVTELNKSVEPKNYWKACKDQHWVEAMNKEMDALYKNDTWEITDLPMGRKSIGRKWFIKSSINLMVKLKDIRLDML
ncbi:ribonuclease H-like domain-containing protein [Tanacetum coccineum]